MSDSSLLTGDATTAAPAATTATPAAGSTPAAAPVVQAQTDPATPPAGDVAAPKVEGDPAGSETAAKGAPESYEAFKVPEGVVIDADRTAALASLAKDLNLDQAAAQRVVDAAAQLAQAQTEAQVAAIAKVRSDWTAEVAADPEVGGERMGENLARAKAAMLATTTPKMQMLLARSGMGDNVEVIRHFLKVAPAFLEDTHVAAIAKVRSDWTAEVAADPEVGGERMGENLARAKAAMLATTTPKMQMLLARSGMGDNVEVIRHFLKVAPAFLEDTHVAGGAAPPGTGKTAAQILYDAPSQT